MPVSRTADGLVLDVNGVGYLLRVSESAGRKAKEGREVSFDTYLHVRETRPAVRVRRAGRAPALRAAAVGVRSRPEGRAAHRLGLVAGGAAALDRARRHHALPGHPRSGKKTAERVVLELKEKMGLEQIVPEGAPDLVARDALVELGYSAVEAERALAGTDPEAPPEERVRQALKAA
jgi:Holliday junction DNA helicase RuvA